MAQAEVMQDEDVPPWRQMAQVGDLEQAKGKEEEDEDQPELLTAQSG